MYEYTWLTDLFILDILKVIISIIICMVFGTVIFLSLFFSFLGHGDRHLLNVNSVQFSYKYYGN